MFRRLKIPIIGALENMSWIECPACGERVALFPPVPTARSIWNDAKCLASLPLIPALASVRSDAAPDVEIDAMFDDLAERLSAAL
jgi:hypothetical protein